MQLLILIIAILIFPAVMTCQAQSGSPEHAFQTIREVSADINLLWTSENAEVFKESIVPYANKYLNKEAGKELTLIIWGPALEMLAEDETLQEKLASLIDKGLEVKTSSFLADQYGITEKLAELGIEVGKTDKIITKPLTERASQVVSL